MKTFRTTLILLLAVLLLGGYILTIERKADQAGQRQERARRAVNFDPSRVTALRLITPQAQATLEKKEIGWWLTAPVKARADAGEVTRILDTLVTLRRSEVISGRQQREQRLDPADFGFQHPRARITLREGEQEWTLLVGRDTPLGGNLFLKLETEASIFVASTNLLSALPARVDALRERKIFLGLPSDVSRLDIRRPDGLLQMARSDQGVWRMQKPYGGRAAYSAVQDLLNGLYEIRVREFVADSIAAASLYGLDEPSAQVTLATPRTPGEQILRLGRVVEGNTNEIYATVEGTETVVTLDMATIQLLATRAADLRDRRLIALPAYDIGYIHASLGEQKITMVREDDNNWWAQEPRRFKADSERIQSALNEWTGLRIETFVDEPGTNLAAWGLSPPDRRITFAHRPPPSTNMSANADETVTVLVARGAPVGEGLILVKLENEDTLFRVPADGLAALPMQPLFYRDPLVVSVEPNDVRSLTRQRYGAEQRVEMGSATGGVWRAARGASIDTAVVSNILATLRQMRAQDFVVEDPEALSTWGLDDPSGALTIGLSTPGAIGKTLLFGDDAGPGSVFAMVRGQEWVFTVSRADRDLLLAPLYIESPTAPERVDTETNRPAPSAPAD